jgi:hypothetical protein
MVLKLRVVINFGKICDFRSCMSFSVAAQKSVHTHHAQTKHIFSSRGILGPWSYFTLKMEAAWSSERLVSCHITTQRTTTWNFTAVKTPIPKYDFSLSHPWVQLSLLLVGCEETFPDSLNVVEILDRWNNRKHCTVCQPLGDLISKRDCVAVRQDTISALCSIIIDHPVERSLQPQ